MEAWDSCILTHPASSSVCSYWPSVASKQAGVQMLKRKNNLTTCTKCAAEQPSLVWNQHSPISSKLMLMGKDFFQSFSFKLIPFLVYEEVSHVFLSCKHFDIGFCFSEEKTYTGKLGFKLLFPPSLHNWLCTQLLWKGKCLTAQWQKSNSTSCAVLQTKCCILSTVLPLWKNRLIASLRLFILICKKLLLQSQEKEAGLLTIPCIKHVCYKIVNEGNLWLGNAAGVSVKYWHHNRQTLSLLFICLRKWNTS